MIAIRQTGVWLFTLVVGVIIGGLVMFALYSDHNADRHFKTICHKDGGRVVYQTDDVPACVINGAIVDLKIK